MSTSADTKAVITTVNRYLEGISQPETAQENIQKAFYSSTNLHRIDDKGDLHFMPRDVLVKRAISGKIPKHKSHILKVEVTNNMAFAKIQLDMLDRDFYDYLTLLKIGSSWKIVSKTYTMIMK